MRLFRVVSLPLQLGISEKRDKLLSLEELWRASIQYERQSRRELLEQRVGKREQAQVLQNLHRYNSANQTTFIRFCSLHQEQWLQDSPCSEAQNANLMNPLKRRKR